MRKFFDNSHSVNISQQTIVFSVFFLLGLYFLFIIRDIVFTFFLAIILMSALDPAVNFFERKLHLPRPAGIAILYIGILLFLVLTLSVIVPPLVSQVPSLIQSLDIPDLPFKISNLKLTLTDVNDFLNQLYSSFGEVFSIVTSTFQGIFTFVTVFVMTAYMLIDRENLHKKIVWFSRDAKHIALAKEFVDSLEVQLGGWVRGELFLMVTIGLFIFIGLTLLGMPYALPLALAAGLLEILPNLGPLVATIPAVVVAFTMSTPALTGAVLVFYIFVQQLENQIIVPRIMKANVDVSPLVTILTILIGFKLGGVFGALLSVPTYIMLRNVYSFWIREESLG